MSLKSILKNFPKPSPADSSIPAAPAPILSSNNPNSQALERNKQLALYHANLIQQQKDVEGEVFAALEELIDFPTLCGSSPPSAAKPSLTDQNRFNSLIQSFQTSDYDALIEERHAAEKCGYVFCPRAPKREISRAGGSRIVWNKHEMKTVPREQIEVWCSKACKRRAMYIKVQLSEDPAWERAGGFMNEIHLLSEDGDQSNQGSSDVDQGEELTQNASERLPVERNCPAGFEATIRHGMAALSLEREGTYVSIRAAGIAKSRIQERAPTRPAEPPVSGSSALDVEGYTPRLSEPGREINISEARDDEDDRDWDMA